LFSQVHLAYAKIGKRHKYKQNFGRFIPGFITTITYSLLLLALGVPFRNPGGVMPPCVRGISLGGINLPSISYFHAVELGMF